MPARSFSVADVRANVVQQGGRQSQQHARAIESDARALDPRRAAFPLMGNGSTDRIDLERELDRLKRRPRRVVHPNSLANLRKRVG